MVGWAIERDILPTSPVVNVKALGKAVERVLTDDELIRLGSRCRTQVGQLASGHEDEPAVGGAQPFQCGEHRYIHHAVVRHRAVVIRR
jgi:hypothetical protein